MSSTSERYHALDTLRAAAMFLGIALHSYLAYTSVIVPFWPVHDTNDSVAGNIFVFTVHEFRMQVFFLLAGFFGCLIFQRYGLAGMIVHRVKRIAIPLLIAMFTIQPLMQLLWLNGDVDSLKYVRFPRPDLNQSTRIMVGEYLASGEFLKHLNPMHLWFLYYLLVCFVLVVPFLILASEESSRKFDQLFLRVLKMPGRSVFLAVFILPSMWLSYRWAIDTPVGWIPDPHIVVYYFLFFGFGWMLYRNREHLSSFVRGWRSQLIVGNLLVLPAQLYFVGVGIPMMTEGERYPPGMIHYKIAAVVLGSIYTWLMVSALVGLFLEYCSGERQWVRYLADASYWCYLMHLLFVVSLQLILQRFTLSGEVKFLLVTFFSISLLLLSYQRFVRHSWIGLLLNGKR